MKNSVFSLLALVTCAAAIVAPSPAEARPVAQSAAVVTPPAGAERYYTILLKRPETGYLFDRFVRTWLAEESPAALESFLREKATSGGVSEGLLLAFYFSHEGRNAEAISAFRNTLEAHPGTASILYEKARVEAATLDFDTALKDLEKAAASVSADDADLRELIAKLRGQLLIRTGEREAAIELWTNLLKEHPDDPVLREDVVQLLVDEGQHEAAMEILDGLISAESDPHKQVMHRLWRGEILRRANKLEDARSVYTDILDDVGQGSWIERELLSQIEQSYRQRQDISGLAERLEALAEAHPERTSIGKALAGVHIELGDSDRGVEIWKNILERTPNDLDSREQYARVLADAQLFDKAAAQVDRLIEARPDDGSLWLRRAEFKYALGESDEAAASVRGYLERAGDEISSYVRAGRTLQRMDLTEEAVSVMREMVAVAPEDRERQTTLAEFLHGADQAEEAMQIWTGLIGDADAEGIIAVARSMRARGEGEAAQDAMLARAETFRDDPAFVATLVESSPRTERPEIVRWGERWIDIAITPDETLRAVATTARLARRAEVLLDLEARLAGEADPGVGTRCLLAEVRELTGDWMGADQALQIAGDQVDERILLQRVRLLKSRREWARAASAMEALAAQDGGETSARLREIIDLHRRARQFDQALSWARRWQTIAPGSVTPWLAEASLLRASDRAEEGLAVLEAASRQFEDATIRIELAEAYREEDRDLDAERVLWTLYDEAESTADRIRWAGRLAETLRWSDRFDTLLMTLEERRSRSRSDVEILMSLAEVYRVGDMYEERRQVLLEASRLEPENIELLLAIARIEEDDGDITNARGTLRRAMLIDTSGRVMERLAALEIAEGNTDAAFALLDDPRAPAMDCEDVVGIANTLFGLGEVESARDFLVPRMARYDDDYRFIYMLGVLEADLGDREEQAIQHMLSVLEIQTEPDGRAGQRLPRSWSVLDGVMPLSALQLTLQQQADSSARSHSTYRGYGYGYGNATIRIPGTVGEAHSYAIAHLRGLSTGMGEDRLTGLTEEMERRGVHLAEILLNDDMDWGMQQGVPEKVLAQYPDEEALLAITAMAGGWGTSEVIEATHLEKAIEIFRDSYPTLALGAACSLMRDASMETEEEQASRWESLLEVIDGVEKPGEYDLFIVGSLLGGLYGQTSASLSEEHRAHLSGVATEWFREIGSGGMYGEYTFAMIAMILVQQEDYASLASILTSEVERHRRTGRQSQSRGAMAQMYAYGANSMPLQAISFPPAQIDSIPTSVASLISGERGGYFSMASGSVDPASLLASLEEQGADPLLRALVAGLADESDRFEELLDPFLASEEPDLDALVIAGAWSAREGRYAESVERLISASYLPMTRARREWIDGCIVGTALLAEAPGDPDRVRRSALRLLQSRRSPAEQDMIVTALADLGHEDEAEQLRESVDQTATGRNPFIRHQYGGASTPGAADRFRDLVDDGRTDSAFRLAARELRPVAQGLLSGNTFITRQEGTQLLVAVIRSEGVEDDFIAFNRPADDANSRQWTLFAGMLDVLERTDEAIEAYTMALSDERPAIEIVARLVNLNVKALEPEAAAAAMARVDLDRDAGALVMVLSEGLSGSLEKLDNRIAAAQAVAIFVEGLEEIPEDFYLNTSFLYDGLARADFQGTSNLPHMYATNQSKADLQLEPNRRRWSAHDRLAEAMLRVPSASPDAFSRLLVSSEVHESDASRFTDLAERVLLMPRGDDMSQLGGLISMSGMRFARMEQQEQFRLRSPAEYLAETLATTDSDRLSRISEAMIEQEHDTDAQLLKSLVALFQVEGEEFTAQAEAFLSIRKQAGSMKVFEDRTDVLLSIMDVREVDPALVYDALLTHFKDGYNDPISGETLPSGISSYAKALVLAGEVRRADQLFEEFATLLIGEASKRDEIIRRNFKSNGWRGGTVNARIHQFLDLLSSCISESSLCIIAFSRTGVLSDPEVNEDFDSLTWYIDNSINGLLQAFSDDKISADSIIEMLDLTRWQDDLDTFDPMRLTDRWNRSSNSRRSVMSLFFESVRRMEDDSERDARPLRRALQAWTEADEPAWGTSIANLWLQREDGAGWCESLAPWAARVDAMESDQQEVVLAAVPSRFKETGDVDGLSPDARIIHEILNGTRDSVDDLLAELLEVKFLKPDERSEYLTRASQTLARLIEDDRFDDAMKLIEHEQKISRGVARRDDGNSPLLSRVANEWEYEEELTAERASGIVSMTLRLIRSADDALNIDQTLRRLRRPLSAMARQQRDELEDSSSVSDREKYARGMLLVLQSLSEEADGLVMLEPLVRALPGVDQELYDRLISWVDSEAPAEGGAPEWYPDLAQAALQLAHLRSEGDEDGGEMSQDLEAAHAGLNALAGQSDLPASLRATAFGTLVSNLPPGEPAKHVDQMVAVLIEVFESEYIYLKGAWLETMLAEIREAPEHPQTAELVQSFMRAVPRASTYGTPMLTSSSVHAFENDAEPDLHSGELILDLALRAGEERTIRTLTRGDAVLGSAPTAWAMMARGGLHEEAAAMIDEWWKEARPVRTSGMLYDEALHEAVGSVAAAIEDPEVALYARIALSLFPDIDPAVESASDEWMHPWPDRDGRLVALANESLEHEFESQQLRRRILRLLAAERASRDVIADALAVTAAEFSLSAPSGFNEEDERLAFELIYAHLVSAIEHGEAEPMLTRISNLKEAMEGAASNSVSVRVTGLQSIFETHVLGRLADPDAGVSRQLAWEIGKELAPMNSEANWYGSYRYASPILTSVLVLGVLEEGCDGLTEWIDTSRTVTDQVEHIEAEELLEFAGGLLAAGTVADDVRIAAVQDMLRCEKIKEFIGPDDWIFGLLQQYDLLTDEDLAAIGPRLVMELGDETWVSLAWTAGHADIDLSDLEELAWTEAMETQEANRGRLRFITYMVRAGRPDLALTYIEGIEPEDDEQRRSIERILSEANEALEAESADEGEEDRTGSAAPSYTLPCDLTFPDYREVHLG